MKILIIEDEIPAFRRLQKMILELLPEAEILEIIDSVEYAIEWFAQKISVELIFMDIQLADGLSFEILEKVKVQTPIIFTTAFDEYTLKAFKFNSIDYLLKPINQEELGQSINKFRNLQPYFNPEHNQVNIEHFLESIRNQGNTNYKSRFLVKIGDKFISVPQEEIAYFFTEDKTVFLMKNTQEKYIVDYSLEELEDLLSPQNFFRLNRQCIAQFSAIDSIHQYFKSKLLVKLKPKFPQEEVIVSREKSSVFKKWLDQ